MPLPKIPRASSRGAHLSGDTGRLSGNTGQRSSGNAGATARVVETSPAQWSERLTQNPDGGNVFQGPAFAEHKGAFGWKPHYVVVDVPGQAEVAVTVLSRWIPGFGAVWYAPKGPGTVTAAHAAEVVQALGELARSNGAFLLKVEPELLDTVANRTTLAHAGLEETWNVQPNGSTVILDITDDLEEIEAGFSRGTRYNIRKARKGGAVAKVVPMTDENCDIFLDLFAETAQGRFSMRNRDYYKSMWKRHEQAGQGCFVFGYVPDPGAADTGDVDGQEEADVARAMKVVCCDFVMLLGHKGSRKDAASLRKQPIRGVPALAVVESIRWLKDHGATEYDLCASPPSEKIKDSDHALYGVGQFKTGFNEHVTDFVGCWDLPLNSVKYKAWTAGGEGALLRVHLKRTGENWY
ncbi:lipid II:glycine glycyltransferase FemX [Kocuria sp.]|uniref:lipid II:glycine glycyltransferase FemX n=1 Tax=Kocuria sp. TaxID=1871328 RepID=UPI0026E0417B|nr:peptidoglycan bridge formation glycyltransferase FemA/FemB family protein [Kocuria sp.]MDO5619540.1 peptidoglycan bridge formation glycyltransferase FemA/FemB family protein [Kocuria sp.]